MVTATAPTTGTAVAAANAAPTTTTTATLYVNYSPPASGATAVMGATICASLAAAVLAQHKPAASTAASTAAAQQQAQSQPLGSQQPAPLVPQLLPLQLAKPSHKPVDPVLSDARPRSLSHTTLLQFQFLPLLYIVFSQQVGLKPQPVKQRPHSLTIPSAAIVNSL